ncbi:MAG: NlpC/P60 family protein [Balneolaceae bacterium]
MARIEPSIRTSRISFLCLLIPGFLISCGIAGQSVSGEDSSLRPGSLIQDRLYEAYREWEGTPYLLGGSTLTGVDCSAFVQRVMSEHFQVELPRNTREQLRVGRGIRRNAMRPGDLVFFRTTRRDLHVGIIVESGEFLHAGVSGGVMISSLEDRYWVTRFLGARRVM